LLVGWDAADWRIIHPLLDAGKMPHLEQLINSGVIGNIATLQPALSPMLWTSIATGKRPYKHGIHGFTEPSPEGGVRPISVLSRKTKALWNILTQNDKKCIVVGWWPSHPAEPLLGGVTVSNHFQRTSGVNPAKVAEVVPGVVYPPRLAAELCGLRMHPSELSGEHILPFVPKAADIDQTKDRRLSSLADILTDCTNIQAAATHLITTEPWDFAAVYFDATDHFGHGFMRYHPPRQKWVSEKDFELYYGVIETAYRYHDLMLGVLLAQAGPETTVLLMSDHGFHPDSLRPSTIPVEPAGPAIEHRRYGILALSGPGLKRDQRLTGATLLDICPTVLTLFGLPVGRDMDGKVLANAWETPPEIAYIDSWDNVPGEAGQHPPESALGNSESAEGMKQLEALGYIDPLPADRDQARRQTQRELDFNLAESYVDGGRHAEAAALLRELWAQWPDEHRFGAVLFACELAMARLAAAREVLDEMKLRRRRVAKTAQAELKAKFADKKREEIEALPDKDKHELRKLRWQAQDSTHQLRWNEARLLLAEGKQAEALAHLEKLEKAGSESPDFWMQMGNAQLGLRRWDAAERAFEKALALDADHADAHLGLANAWLGGRRNFEAAGRALTAIGLLYHNPAAHFLLGVALARIGDTESALRAYQVCLAQNPNYVAAHQRLAQLYTRRLKQPDKARAHREAVVEIRARARKLRAGKTTSFQPAAVKAGPVESEKPAAVAVVPPGLPRGEAAFATIVTGLPRSGTSLMMQMLAAGGVPPLHDGKRAPDSDNPRGYYEFAPARNLRADASWFPEATGRVLKLVAQLLPAIPVKADCRIIWMERPLDEVLASQAVMLDRLQAPGARLGPAQLRKVFEQQIKRVEEAMARRKMAVLKINYHDCVRDPAGVVSRIAEFLGLPLDRAAMAQAVNPALHRQRG
jgi:tetratricopeptide (TPR) repeat protein